MDRNLKGKNLELRFYPWLKLFFKVLMGAVAVDFIGVVNGGGGYGCGIWDVW